MYVRVYRSKISSHSLQRPSTTTRRTHNVLTRGAHRQSCPRRRPRRRPVLLTSALLARLADVCARLHVLLAARLVCVSTARWVSTLSLAACVCLVRLSEEKRRDRPSFSAQRSTRAQGPLVVQQRARAVTALSEGAIAAHKAVRETTPTQTCT
ncbi:uncharacterized protein C8Q71DRAFT_288563 [Rhodofomes roseus]|uniref:Uncharacterized protein n=1 Tax=Rhodofomes roseus TaxID=34475 RepID=A0ABQ8K581_9APHY|nr:uncharacterized protein C8Q71DRAFT_288563 [Rhodofomes roseus]KAH9831873.1 hypothetical protein C8Q71DRAFT_288563 [Rhodofomes roseus]